MRKLLLALLFISVTNLADAAVCGNKAMKYFSVGLVDEEAEYEKINKPSAIKMYWSKGDLPAKIVWKKLAVRKKRAKQLFSFKNTDLGNFEFYPVGPIFNITQQDQRVVGPVDCWCEKKLFAGDPNPVYVVNYGFTAFESFELKHFWVNDKNAPEVIITPIPGKMFENMFSDFAPPKECTSPTYSSKKEQLSALYYRSSNSDDKLAIDADGSIKVEFKSALPYSQLATKVVNFNELPRYINLELAKPQESNFAELDSYKTSQGGHLEQAFAEDFYSNKEGFGISQTEEIPKRLCVTTDKGASKCANSSEQ